MQVGGKVPEPPKSKLDTCSYYQGHEKGGGRGIVYRCEHCGRYFCEEHRNPKIPQAPPYKGKRFEMQKWREPGHPCFPYIKIKEQEEEEAREKWQKVLDEVRKHGKPRREKPVEYPYPPKPRVPPRYPPPTHPPLEELGPKIKVNWRKIGEAVAILISIGFISVFIYLAWQTGKLPGLPNTGGGGAPSINVPELERRVFELVNQERISQGLSVLVWDNGIADVARLHSQDMAVNNYFSHQNLQGLNVGDRLTNGGVVYSSCGEIILEQSVIKTETTHYVNGIPIHTSKDYKTQEELAEDAVSGWMNSSGHRAIILTPGFVKAGVGVASSGDTYYFTEDFVE